MFNNISPPYDNLASAMIHRAALKEDNLVQSSRQGDRGLLSSNFVHT